MQDVGAYVGLFSSAFIAATLLPTASEAVLVGLLLSDRHPVAMLLLVASVGNVLGSVVNWCLGRWIEHFRGSSWFPIKPQAMARAQRWYQRYGKWSLLLSWAPVVGDPLTVAAGIMREPFLVFLLLVTLAKVGRYLVLAGMTLGVN